MMNGLLTMIFSPAAITTASTVASTATAITSTATTVAKAPVEATSVSHVVQGRKREKPLAAFFRPYGSAKCGKGKFSPSLLQ